MPYVPGLSERAAGPGRPGGSVSIPSHAITFFCPERKRLGGAPLPRQRHPTAYWCSSAYVASGRASAGHPSVPRQQSGGPAPRPCPCLTGQRGAQRCGRALAEGGGGDAGRAGGTERCRSAAGAFPAWHGDGCGPRTLVLHPWGRAGGRRAMPRRAGTGPQRCHRGCRAIALLPTCGLERARPLGALCGAAPCPAGDTAVVAAAVVVVAVVSVVVAAPAAGAGSRGVSGARAGAGSAGQWMVLLVWRPRCRGVRPGACGAAGPSGAGTGARAQGGSWAPGPVAVSSLTVKGAGPGPRSLRGAG